MDGAIITCLYWEQLWLVNIFFFCINVEKKIFWNCDHLLNFWLQIFNFFERIIKLFLNSQMGFFFCKLSKLLLMFCVKIRKLWIMILSPLVDGISNFLGETCLHGFKYLGPNNGVLTRVVWVSQNFVRIVIIYCTLSWVETLKHTLIKERGHW